MSGRTLARMACVALLAAASGGGAQATPLRSPKRVVNEQTVDLSLLFHWWKGHEGERPLGAWAHLSGKVVGTNGWGWIVEARVEGGRHASGGEGGNASGGGTKRILLQHPPMQERAEFERLAAQLKALNAERTQVTGVENAAKNRSQSISKQQQAYYRRSRAQAVAARDARLTEARAKDELQKLDKQIQDTRAKLAGYPDTETYALDCFALDTGQRQGPLPLYDHGMTMP